MDTANRSGAQRSQERENAARKSRDPASAGFNKKTDGPNRPAE